MKNQKVNKQKDQNPKENKVEFKIKTYLAEHIGVEIDDIGNEDNLANDLHMTPSDITDFIESLRVNFPETGELKIENFEKVIDIIEEVKSKQDVE